MFQAITHILSVGTSDSQTSTGNAETTSQSQTRRGGDLSATDGDEAVTSILNGLETPATFVGTEGRIRNINEQATNLFDTTEAEAKGTAPDSLHDADSDATDFVNQVLRTEEDIQQVQESIKVGGQEITSERTVTPIYDGQNELVGVLELNRDVTEREKERARKNALETYQQRVLDDLQDKISRLAEGDLTIDPTVPEPDADFEEMQTVYGEFTAMNQDLNRAADNISAVVDDLQSVADDLVETGQELGGTSEEVTSSIEQISASSSEVTEGAEDMAQKAEMASQNVTELSSSIEEVTATLQQIDTQSKEAASLANEGTTDVSTAVDQIRDAVEAMGEIEAAIQSLESQMDDVGEITEVIADIADQTNLLALNANIEAARADKSGDGFAVVADEIKDLADESQTSTEEITEIIKEAQEETATVTERYETVNSEINEGVDAVETVVDTLGEIEESIEETSQGVAEASDAVESQAENAEEVSSAVEDTSAMTQQITGSMQEVASGVDQQSTAMDEVAEMAQLLSQRSDTLQEKVAQFKVDTDDTATLDN